MISEIKMNEYGDVIRSVFGRHFDVFKRSLESILDDVERAAFLLGDAVRGDHRLFVCGNGGSAADSQHFAAEWVCRFKNDRKPLPAIALTVDTSVLTAIGNDYDFNHIFSRQVQALGGPEDVLVAITTSGASSNVLLAIDQAKLQGLKVIALTGEGGKELKEKVDVAIVVPSEETARIQEMHELIYHAWCEFVDAQFFGA